MCKITNAIECEGTLTGYKVVVKRAGKYYSMSTGIEYKIGSVPDLPDDSKPASALMATIKKDKSFYNPMMLGCTACFYKINDAVQFLNWAKRHQIMNNKYFKRYDRYRNPEYNESQYTCELAVLEITLDNLRYEGVYIDDAKVFLGMEISYIKEISTSV